MISKSRARILSSPADEDDPKELGDEDLSRRDADDYSSKLEALDLDEEIAAEAAREIDRLRHIQPSSSEYQVIKTYLDRFFSLPWGQYSDEQIQLSSVRETLDDGHFGLEQVKERILEFLAVRKLNPDHKGPILCFVGPPGVGKTSLGKSIAEAIGRDFFRISVGGVRDEAEIRGHRRTYVGAMPGKILNGLARAGAMNPLLMLDEIDKIGSDQRGVVPPLLKVLVRAKQYVYRPLFQYTLRFIKGALCVDNQLLARYSETAARPTRGHHHRLYGDEKCEIASRHLIPGSLNNPVYRSTPNFSEPAVRGVRYWTREAGFET